MEQMSRWRELFKDCEEVPFFSNRIPICSPEDLLKNGLFLFLAPTIIISIITVLAGVKSWVDFGKFSLKSAREVLNGVRSVAQRARRATSKSIAVGVTITVAVILLQLLWVGLSYYVGNSVRLFVEGVTGTLDAPDRLDVRVIPELLHSDGYTKVAAAALLVTAVLSWLPRGRSKKFERMVMLVSIPGGIWAFFGLVGGVLNSVPLLIVWLTGKGDYGYDLWGVAYMFAFGVAGWLYLKATQLVLAAPVWLWGHSG